MTTFAAELKRWREIFLGVLGHDLRGPLNAMSLTAEVLARAEQDTDFASPANAMQRHARHMDTLLNALLEYSRSELGMPLAICRSEVQLASLCQDEIDLLRPALPGADVIVVAEGDTTGHFDGARIREALANLVFNATQHGSGQDAVKVHVKGLADAVQIPVDNKCEPIPQEVLQNLFEPLRRYASTGGRPDRHLGLGLFIVREIARAHGGDVTVSMADGRVTFSLLLPKVSQGTELGC